MKRLSVIAIALTFVTLAAACSSTEETASPRESAGSSTVVAAPSTPQQGQSSVPVSVGAEENVQGQPGECGTLEINGQTGTVGILVGNISCELATTGIRESFAQTVAEGVKSVEYRMPGEGLWNCRILGAAEADTEGYDYYCQSALGDKAITWNTGSTAPPPAPPQTNSAGSPQTCGRTTLQGSSGTVAVVTGDVSCSEAMQGIEGSFAQLNSGPSVLYKINGVAMWLCRIMDAEAESAGYHYRCESPMGDKLITWTDD